MICGRLHRAIRASVANFTSTRLLPPRTAVKLSASTVVAVLLGLAVIWGPGEGAADPPDRAILLLFPKPEEVRPWVPDGPAQIAEGQDLFALVDGGAKLFLRHGFERAAVQSYTLAEDRHIQVEIYMMRSMDGAAEVFARKSGPGELPLALGDAGAGGEYYIVFRRGRFLVTVTAGDANADAGRRRCSASPGQSRIESPLGVHER